MRSLFLVLLSVAVSLTAFHFIQKGTTGVTGKETAFERVMLTKILRCGYIVWPPEFNKDIKDGTYSGVAYDLIEEAAKRLDIKVEWVEETDFTSAVSGLNDNRFDMLCFSSYRRSTMAKDVTFSVPLFYSGVGVFVRPDDKRFDADLNLINKPDTIIATLDGDQAQIIADEQFSDAKRYALPAPNDFSSLLLSVAQEKADVSFANIGNAYEFMQKNPGLVRQINDDKPIRLFSHGFVTKKEDGGLNVYL